MAKRKLTISRSLDGMERPVHIELENLETGNTEEVFISVQDASKMMVVLDQTLTEIAMAHEDRILEGPEPDEGWSGDGAEENPNEWEY